MNYRIKLAYLGGKQNNIGNQLNKLDGSEHSTRDDACEAIYAALEGVISGDGGCEMINLEHGPFWRAMDSIGNAHEYLEDRSSAENRAELMGEGWEADFDLDAYCSACHDYIMREGYATEDGVTATVEKVAE